VKENKKELVWVEWGDAWGNAGWANPDDDLHNPKLVVTVGFLYKNDKKGVTLFQGYDKESNQPLARTFIPAGMVSKIKKLRY
jgi:hypothetical protein